jgi:hypothetical protein
VGRQHNGKRKKKTKTKKERKKNAVTAERIDYYIYGYSWFCCLRPRQSNTRAESARSMDQRQQEKKREFKRLVFGVEGCEKTEK